MFAIIKTLCIIISVWWIVAVVADLLYIFFSHDPTALTTFACNPFCIILFPMLELKMHKGALVWLLGLAIVIFTAIYLI